MRAARQSSDRADRSLFSTVQPVLSVEILTMSHVLPSLITQTAYRSHQGLCATLLQTKKKLFEPNNSAFSFIDSNEPRNFKQKLEIFPPK